MPRMIANEVLRFRQSFDKLKKKYKINKEGDDLYIIEPLISGLKMMGDKKIALTIGAITHGNETAGIGIVNDILALLCSDLIQVRVPMAFMLGNVPAAMNGVRYLDRDLNRSFASKTHTQKEQIRAREMEKLLADTAWFIDLHQVSLSTEEPFFIFPYHKESFAFARSIAKAVPIVTHWDDGFSADGKCSDEYVISKGGVGISLETGRNGFDPMQIGLGVEVVLSAMAYVQEKIGKAEQSHRDPMDQQEMAKVYTFAKVYPYPSEGRVKLKEGLHNFKDIREGEFLACLNGSVLNAPQNGKVLFPKYLEEDAPKEKRPAELLRILAEVSEADLPA